MGWDFRQRWTFIIAAHMSASRHKTRRPDASATPDAAIDGAETDDRPSKSQRKRDAHALQVLGVKLIDLRDDALLRLPLDANLIEAIRFARTIRSHEGRRRQLQRIGKLMRAADGDAIRSALGDETREQRLATAIQHAAEAWRERMIADPRVAANWLDQYPATREAIEALLPGARAEMAAGAPGRACRELFRKIRKQLESKGEESR
jgi:ribosome-associated protein